MRNIFRIESKFQLRYLRVIELSLLIPTLVVGGCLYYLVFTLIAEEIAIPEFISLMLYPALVKINTILIIALPAIFIPILGWGLVLSHRLAGPIDRLNREVKRITEGELKGRIRLRKNDALKGVADNINKLLDKVSEGRH